MLKKIAVCGGGPAGLFAAIHASETGAKVTVFEKMPSPCRKLLITGKGRCNVTNGAPIKEVVKKFRGGPNFIKKIFPIYFNRETITFFNKMGVELKEERGGRIFPASDKAQDIVNAILEKAKKENVKIVSNCPVTSLLVKNSKCLGVKVNDNKVSEKFFDSVIIATGGVSYPATGSTGDGYRLASKVGHKVKNPAPALVPLETFSKRTTQIQGVSLRNITASLWNKDKKIKEGFGELLFTHFGLSGPVILTLSRTAVELINEGKNIELSIDLKPALDHKKLDQRLLREIRENKKKHLENLLKSLLPSKMIPFCLSELKLNGKKAAHEISKEERKKIRLWLKNLRFNIKQPRPLNEAIVTSGGILTKEIHPVTMESRIIKNLYFAGETIDIDADTGGYNLQAAFSTGYLAGISAAQ